MPIQKAEQTLKLIDVKLVEDNGASFRGYLGEELPKLDDAYDSEPHDPHRSHLGLSTIGNECARSLWYVFHWYRRNHVDGKLQRLFNRGHLEEGRFIALLRMLGLKGWTIDPSTGGQIRVSHAGGHVGSALDGVFMGFPELPPNTPALAEMKTHGDKSFTKLKKDGVEKSKPVHFVQTQVYMHKAGLQYAVYMAVNKNTDELWFEIIEYDRMVALRYLERAEDIVFTPRPPPRIKESPGWFPCKWCNFATICHYGDSPERNCRTCVYAQPTPDGLWQCNQHGVTLSKQTQLEGCPSHTYIPED